MHSIRPKVKNFLKSKMILKNREFSKNCVEGKWLAMSHKYANISVYPLAPSPMKRIMIVEDQPALAQMYREKFESGDYEVTVCSDGLSAIAKLMSADPHIILLDIMMPTMDGMETLRVIRELAPSVRTNIVILSNLETSLVKEECEKHGIRDYIVKSNTTPRELYERIDAIVNATWKS